MSRKIKLISFIIALALTVSVFAVGVPEADASTASAGVVNTQANLRESASTASDIIIAMAEGDKVSVTGGESDGWYKVKFQGKTGYVRSDYIDVMITGMDDPGVIISETAMTKEHDPASEVVQTLALEAQVTVTGAYGSMYEIKSGSKTGFVPKSCVHKYSIFSVNLNASLNSSGVKLRSIPSTTGEALATLKKGTVVHATSLRDHWVKVTYSDKTGYVRGDFLTYNSPSGLYLTEMAPGMRSQAVTELQIALRKKGFFHTAPNGVYGSATRSAVAKFQASVYLDSDGIAGEQTLLLLFGSRGAAALWYNYRSEMPAQKPQTSGRVILQDWFDTDSSKGMQSMMKKGVDNAFEVIDVRTGIHWNMMRFGDVTAHWHADVCPVTKADTQAMTKAWGGELDSARRPVWVKLNGKYYAAGLMGFVHNTDPLSDNGMDGQVCLHFRGSKIHSSGHIDEAQQACIMEALYSASKLDAYIKAHKV